MKLAGFMTEPVSTLSKLSTSVLVWWPPPVGAGSSPAGSGAPPWVAAGQGTMPPIANHIGVAPKAAMAELEFAGFVTAPVSVVDSMPPSVLVWPPSSQVAAGLTDSVELPRPEQGADRVAPPPCRFQQRAGAGCRCLGAGVVCGVRTTGAGGYRRVGAAGGASAAPPASGRRGP